MCERNVCLNWIVARKALLPFFYFGKDVVVFALADKMQWSCHQAIDPFADVTGRAAWRHVVPVALH